MRTPAVEQADVWDGRGLRANVFLIDVRTPAEYREVHIPGSANYPLGEVAELLTAVKERAGEAMAIVCHTKVRSQVVQKELADRGAPTIPVLRGGMVAWLESGLPVVRDERGVSLQRKVQVAAGLLVVLGVLLGAFVSPWLLLLPGLVGAALLHAGVTGTSGLATLVAKLPFDRS